MKLNNRLLILVFDKPNDFDSKIDFAIPDAQDLKITEVTSPALFLGKSKNYRFYICLLDHKFQMIKAKHPSAFTVMALIPNGVPADLQRTREMIRAETLNTDMPTVKEEEFKNLLKSEK